MRCPFCNAEDSRVIDSRPVDNEIRRRRQCETCGRRFTTYEKIETIPMMIIKKDNSREPYDRSKIEAGILRACHKRPISIDTIRSLVDDVENQIQAEGSREIPSSEIGEMIMQRLQALDDVAYVRFASVYRDFKDVETFLKEIEKIAKKHS